MGKVKIFTDSTADLSSSLIRQYSISTVPLYVVLGDNSFHDNGEITTKEMYHFIDESQSLPKTSAPTIEDFISAFQPWIADGYDIIYIGLSSKLSATMQAAHLASREWEEGRVYVIDSLNLSTGIGLLVLKASELAQQGLDAASIVPIISSLSLKVKSSFTIDTLKYLHMGGRCSSIQMLAGTLLKIRPQIIVKDGQLTVGEKYRGSRKHCLDRFYDTHIKKMDLIDNHRIFITHSACPEDADYLKEN